MPDRSGAGNRPQPRPSTAQLRQPSSALAPDQSLKPLPNQRRPLLHAANALRFGERFVFNVQRGSHRSSLIKNARMKCQNQASNAWLIPCIDNGCMGRGFGEGRALGRERSMQSRFQHPFGHATALQDTFVFRIGRAQQLLTQTGLPSRDMRSLKSRFLAAPRRKSPWGALGITVLESCLRCAGDPVAAYGYFVRLAQ